MVLKRKRNLKIDSSAVYSVFLLRDLNIDEIEDYVEARDTGMEADEEKEVHLQKIIKGENKDIPLPVIEILPIESRAKYKKKTLKRHIEWDKDCRNIYIEDKDDKIEENTLLKSGKGFGKIKEPLDSLENQDVNKKEASIPGIDKKVIEEVKAENKVKMPESENEIIINAKDRHTGEIEDITSHKSSVNEKSSISSKINFTNLIKEVGDDKTMTFGKNDQLLSFCMKRSIIRYEKHGYESYVCFRNRVFHPTFKSRRNEVLMMEKLERLGIELATLKNMCSMLKEKYKLEAELVKKTTKSLKVIKKIKLKKTRRRILRKLLVDGPVKVINSAPPVNLQSLMMNRDKIMLMKKAKGSTDLYLDIKYYNEIMNLISANPGEDSPNVSEEPYCPSFDDNPFKIYKYS